MILMNLTTRRTSDPKTRRLGRYPALAGASKGALADIATWADEFTISSGEVVGGLTPIGRWTYLIADPSAQVLVRGGCRPAGQALTHADHSGDVFTVVAVDDLTVLAVPPQRLHAVLEIAPRLADTLRDAAEQTAVVDPLCREGIPKTMASLIT